MEGQDYFCYLRDKGTINHWEDINRKILYNHVTTATWLTATFPVPVEEHHEIIHRIHCFWLPWEMDQNYGGSRKMKQHYKRFLLRGHQQKDFIQPRHNCHLVDSDCKMSSIISSTQYLKI
ncbi:uncharacterized protein AAG666_004154 isoform 1-T1 [Megaptera novaeangliae]